MTGGRTRSLASWVGACLLVIGAGRLPAAAAGLTEIPLAARSRPAGTTMFTSLPAAQTGIVAMNDYADPGMWAERYQELAYGAMGTGVAVGDYDADGRPDVFVVSKTGRSRLFRNLGNWKFE